VRVKWESEEKEHRAGRAEALVAAALPGGGVGGGGGGGAHRRAGPPPPPRPPPRWITCGPGCASLRTRALSVRADKHETHLAPHCALPLECGNGGGK